MPSTHPGPSAWPIPPGALFIGAHSRSALVAVGVHDRELRGPLWQQVNRGLWAWAACEDPTLESLIARAAPLVCSGGAIGGWAAARLLGVTDLDGHDQAGNRSPILVCQPPAARCRRTRGVHIFRSALAADEVVRVHGLPVTSPLRTCADIARLTTPAREAVVCLDAARSPLRVPASALSAWIDSHRRWRGVPQARRVLDLSRTGVKSAQESRLRLIWTLEAGLPEPLVNASVLGPDGRLLCEADLLEPSSGLVAEFDGAHHASASQRGVDHVRRDQMRRAGLTVVVITSPGLTVDSRRTVHRLRAAYRSAMSRDRRLDSWYVPTKS